MNPELLDEKQVCNLCALQPPIFLIFFSSIVFFCCFRFTFGTSRRRRSCRSCRATPTSSCARLATRQRTSSRRRRSRTTRPSSCGRATRDRFESTRVFFAGVGSSLRFVVPSLDSFCPNRELFTIVVNPLPSNKSAHSKTLPYYSLANV